MRHLIGQTPRLPAVTQAAERVWVFDLDNTLYPASSNLFAQVDQRMTQFIGEHLKLDPVAAHQLQKHYYRTYGTTLRGLMQEHGMSADLFLAYVHEIDVTPVAPSEALDRALGQLVGRKVIYTNGSEKHAANVTGRLGISHHFEGVFDIKSSDYLPKPEPEPYRMMMRHFAIQPERAIMIEDLPRNLLPAHEAGMTTLLVLGNEELADLNAEGPHIHNVTEDLAEWLEAAAGVQHEVTFTDAD
jgi:putative hydrolase of the HAD superfamily